MPSRNPKEFPAKLYRYRSPDYIKREIEELSKSVPRTFFRHVVRYDDDDDMSPKICASPQEDMGRFLREYIPLREQFYGIDYFLNRCGMSNRLYRKYSDIPLQSIPALIRELRSYTQYLFDATRNSAQIACFVDNPINRRMWSQYASGASGVCLEVSLPKDIEKINAMARFNFNRIALVGVNYNYKREEVSEVDILRGLISQGQDPEVFTKEMIDSISGNTQLHDRVFATKHKDFEDEREIRMLNFDADDYKPIAPYVLSAVYMGKRIDHENMVLLRELSKKHDFDLYQTDPDAEYGY